jgi:hypothetical protein
MIIGVYGHTDKRPVTYTLMKLLQSLGDVAVISDNRHYTRLTEDRSRFGFFQNISVFVTDTSYDEVFQEIEHIPSDYDFIIMENKYSEKIEASIYVQGAGVEELDEDLLEALDKPILVNLGFGKNKISYTANMFKALEEIEFYRILKPVDNGLTNLLSKALSQTLNLPTATVRKVVNR